jgi:hypothetical protein
LGVSEIAVGVVESFVNVARQQPCEAREGSRREQHVRVCIGVVLSSRPGAMRCNRGRRSAKRCIGTIAQLSNRELRRPLAAQRRRAVGAYLAGKAARARVGAVDPRRDPLCQRHHRAGLGEDALAGRQRQIQNLERARKGTRTGAGRAVSAAGMY